MELEHGVQSGELGGGEGPSFRRECLKEVAQPLDTCRVLVVDFEDAPAPLALAPPHGELVPRKLPREVRREVHEQGR